MTYIESPPFQRYRPLIDDWPAFQAAIRRPLSTTLWTNTLKTTPERLAHFLPDAATPIPWYSGGFRLSADFQSGLHWSYLTGLYQVQEEIAMLPTRLLDPLPGERVLDLCAAPGNKTVQLSIAMRNSGSVVANDRNAGRMRAARHALDRLGIYNVTTLTHDGANLPGAIGQFDKVLVDAPCSCEGICRKDSNFLKSDSNHHHHKLAQVQKALLRKAVQLCRPGGRIVYATCTFAPEENEMVVDAILREAGDEVALVTPALPTELHWSPGITHWSGQKLRPSLVKALRFWPHQNDTGGFFIAVLEKRPSTDPPPSSSPLPFTIERQPWLGILHRRFGINPVRFDPYRIFRWSKKRIYLVNEDHHALATPHPDAVGMFFMRTDGKYPKMSTGAAMTFGHLAQQNVIDLTPEQAGAYIGREDFGFTEQQAAACTDTGYVLLRYRSFTLGVGVYRPRQGIVESLYPKGWSREQVIL